MKRSIKRSVQQGFSLTELVVGVGVLGTIVLVGVGSYQWYIPKAQAQEAANQLQAQLIPITASMKDGKCLNATIKGKYGSIVASGDFKLSQGASCNSGCQIKYVFNENGVHKNLKGSQVVTDIRNDYKLSLNSTTTTHERFLPENLVNMPSVAGDNCNQQNPTSPLATNGSGDNSLETGDSAPTPPAPVTPPSGGTTPPPSPPAPVTPPPSGGTTPPPPTTGEVVNAEDPAVISISGNAVGVRTGWGPWNFPGSSMGFTLNSVSGGSFTSKEFGNISFASTTEVINIYGDALTRIYTGSLTINAPADFRLKYPSAKLTLTNAAGSKTLVYGAVATINPRFPYLYVRQNGATNGAEQTALMNNSFATYPAGNYTYVIEFIK